VESVPQLGQLAKQHAVDELFFASFEPICVDAEITDDELVPLPIGIPDRLGARVRVHAERPAYVLRR
jgi:hypothetical protein